MATMRQSKKTQDEYLRAVLNAALNLAKAGVFDIAITDPTSPILDIVDEVVDRDGDRWQRLADGSWGARSDVIGASTVSMVEIFGPVFVPRPGGAGWKTVKG